MKYSSGGTGVIRGKSPSVWREWIEMHQLRKSYPVHIGLPPCGGSGLKYTHCKYHTSNNTVSLRVEGVD